MKPEQELETTQEIITALLSDDYTRKVTYSMIEGVKVLERVIITKKHENY